MNFQAQISLALPEVKVSSLDFLFFTKIKGRGRKMVNGHMPETIQFGQCYTAERERVICEFCLNYQCILHPECAE
jgi:hypothetical protein